MDGELLAGILGFVALVAWIRAAGNPFMFTAIFRSPLKLGWPRGVQEDDDLHWRWGRDDPGAASGNDDSDDRDELVVAVTGVVPRVRSARGRQLAVG